jgi:hypothetical protein
MTPEQCARLDQLIEAVVSAELDMDKAGRMHTYIVNAEAAKLEAHTALDKFKGELTTPDEPEETETKETN